MDHHIKETQAEDNVPLAAVIRKAVHMPLALSLALEVVSQALAVQGQLTYPPLGDIRHRALELVRQAFDLCLSPNCPSTVSIRTKTLISLISSATLLLNESIGSNDCSWSLLDSLKCRTLLYRLQLGPRPELQLMDTVLQTVFQKPARNSLPLKEDIISILEVLRTIPSREENAPLHVRRVYFLSSGQALILQSFRHLHIR